MTRIARVLLLGLLASQFCFAETGQIFDGEVSLVHADFQLADGAGWDGSGSLYVPDVKGKRLLKFNLRKPTEAPRVRNQGLAISGCCYQLGQLYISDNANSRIAVLGNAGPPKTIAQLDPKNRPNDFTGSLDNPQRNEPSRQKMNDLGCVTTIVIYEGQKHGHWNRAESIEQVVSDIDSFLKLHL